VWQGTCNRQRRACARASTQASRHPPVVQVAIFERADATPAPPPTCDVPGATKTFEGADVSEAAAARSAAEYAALRKEGYRAEAAAQAAPAYMDKLLAQLAAFELPDEDVCD
jgi:hypothetical protein